MAKQYSFKSFDMAVDDFGELNKLIRNEMSMIRKVAADVCEVFEGDEARQPLDELKGCMKSAIEQENDNKKYVEVAKALSRKVAANPEALHGSLRQELVSAYEAAKGRQENPEIHAEFKDLLKITSAADRGASSFQDSCDGMTISEDLVDGHWIDPITQKNIEVPVKNMKCGHIYDKNSISHYIKITNRPRCPCLGCGNKSLLRMEDLVDDLFLARVLKDRSEKND
uniref:E3 SUMO-protein ligase NSE2 n=2 Tax=Amblyomma TaxID=6942 RepID=G3MRK4_AMBMU